MKTVFFGPVPSEWGGRKAGGVASYNRSLAAALADYSSAVSSCTLVPTQDQAPPHHLPKGITINPKAMSAKRGDNINSFLEDADVAVFHHLMNPAVESFLLNDVRLASICIVHSWTPYYKNPSWAKEIQRRMDAMDALVFPSFHCIDEGRRLGFSIPAKASVVYGAVKPIGQPPCQNATERRGVLFAGQLLPVKQPHLLIRAASLLPEDITISVAGDGPLMGELETLIRQELPLGKVELLGELPHDDLTARMSGAAVLCVPSTRESFGLVYIEALSSGTPIVGFAPSVEEISDRVGRQVGVGFSGDCAVELAAALQKSLQMDWDHDAIARITSASFSPGQMANDFDRVLNDL